MDRPTAFELFESARVARLATVSAEGQPHVVPIVFAFDGSDLVTAIDQKPKRSRALRRLDNIRSNSQVSVLADRYDDDWTRLWWVRVDGTATIVDRVGDTGTGLAALAAKYPQYREVTPDGPFIRIVVERLSGWSAGASPKSERELR